MIYTPKIEELLPSPKLHCELPNCSRTYSNTGNYIRHLLQYHHFEPITSYYCPVQWCKYHVDQNNGRHFKALRYVQQHYQKVHAEKPHKCAKCNESFLTPEQLKAHVEHMCGRTYNCNECGANYKTNDSLTAHAKHKGHLIKPASAYRVNRNFAIPPVLVYSQTAQNVHHEENNQTDFLHSSKFSSYATTILASQTPFASDSDVEAVLRDIETQTDHSSINNTEEFTAMHAVEFLDQMLATQDFDELLSELGLVNISTQTNWSDTDLSAPTSVASFSSTLAPSNNSAVSTETQSSSSQCLLDVTTNTNQVIIHDDHQSNNNSESCVSDLVNVHTEQFTQPCNDLIN